MWMGILTFQFHSLSGPAALIVAARENRPGRYQVDEFSATGETLSGGHTARQCGVIIHQADGTIISEPNPRG
jgi:hypothetical protein